ncbi:thiol:disulfide interchange protein DsbD [Nicoletella semolina]|uniref:Thiol:disulfide interchange protein DsbD n=1 Tax=Nicoletella semolina TaxID=271160 RepID=A0A4R2NCB8_9PAST|nr:protein-disulfide reductase DsbD [Nicoletella semolina]MDH2924272.1 protein-disulfide reductase DsbD [Nicoletella semolina]TCP18831.1 thiol:disulfide interchange protein DsbD [Nicoletella semolina]
MRLWILLLTLGLSLFAHSDLFKSKPKFLSSEQAFIFSSQPTSKGIELNWQIASGYYLYKKAVEIKPVNSTLGKWQFPASERHNDEFFGEVEIYRDELAIDVPILSRENNAQLEIHYQGCTEGFCYPPEVVTVSLDGTAAQSPLSSLPSSEQQAVETEEKFAKNTAERTAHTAEQTEVVQAEQDRLAEQLSANRFSIFWFFVLGLGLAFTPCVLPMLPLLSAIVIGNQKRPNSVRAFLLSITYVQGMALTYTLLGLIVAAIGLPFQQALQSPPVLITLTIVFILLALSMFGLFTIQLPHSWQQKLNTISQQQKGGSFTSVFIMGMVAGLVASPCTSAPLSGALLYVAQSGDLFTGGLALYLLALGMGIPLVLITLFGNKVLPKSGDWLLKVKTMFGFVMLALPVFLLSRILPAEFEPFMWSALAIAFLFWLNEQFAGKSIVSSIVRLIILICVILTGKPWADLIWQPHLSSTQSTAQQTTNHFVKVHSLAELEQQLQANSGKKVMFDLYADWCVACKEFEKYTFHDPKVQAKLNEILILQVDMTKNSPENEALLRHFQVLGLPTILFFDEQGQELNNKRVTGFMPAKPFLAWLEQL